MKKYFLEKEKFNNFVEKIIERYPVIAPVAKKKQFVFSDLKSVDDLRLDYDTTLLPPKKVFFPTKQNLLKFDNNKIEDCIDANEKVLFGVHPYDIKAISMLDILFSENHKDNNYLSNRNSTIIIGSNVQNIYKYAFFGTQCNDMELKGHDIFITKITNGYIFEFISEKGENFLDFASFEKVNEDQILEAELVNKNAEKNCPEKLNYSSSEIKEKIRKSFKSEIWDELSEKCFSCNSCNMVCPTCYCFDVQDVWNIDQKSGVRYRRWDGCQSIDFAEVSVQDGTENFREKKSSRYRHRVLRKTVYLNDKLGNPACVGCGRCSGTCTVDIVNPVKTINRIMEV